MRQPASEVRASSTAPGVFAPVEIDGRLLVDGGLVDNLPVEVARQMGVDVLIVVDVGFPLRSRQSLDSAPNISAQMLSIMVRRGSDAQRGLLRASDVLVSPALGVEDSTFDLGITTRAIGLGEQAAQAVGIPLQQIWGIVWGVAGFVALVAGLLWGSRNGVQFSLTFVALKALPVLILGGFTSVPGAILGGLIIGASEKLAEVYIGPFVGGGIEGWFPYVLALLFLLVRPEGLFGEKIIRRV